MASNDTTPQSNQTPSEQINEEWSSSNPLSTCSPLERNFLPDFAKEVVRIFDHRFLLFRVLFLHKLGSRAVCDQGYDTKSKLLLQQKRLINWHMFDLLIWCLARIRIHVHQSHARVWRALHWVSGHEVPLLSSQLDRRNGPNDRSFRPSLS